MVIKLNTARLNGTRLNSASLNGAGERLRASAGGGGGVIIPPSEPEEPDTPVTYTLAATADNGKVSASVNGNAVTLPYTANEGDVVVVEVTANDGYEFEGWSDGSTDNPRSITMSADVTLSATCVVKAVEKEYIQFADPAVEAVLMANGVSSDGVGITKDDAAAVTSIGTWFGGNTEITSFDEFQYFTGVTQVGYSTASTSKWGFNGCTALMSIKLPNSITIIGRDAFASVPATSYNLTNVTSILGGAFGNSGIEDVNAPNLETLDQNVFRNCISLKTVTSLGRITKTMSTTGAYGLFYGCTSLVSVNLPNTLEEIGGNTFSGCTALSVINIPVGIKIIGNGAFNNCTSLAFDYLNLANLESLGQNAFYGVKIKKLSIPRLISFPNGSTSSQNFGSRSNLEELEISESVTTIPMYFLHGYSKITSLNLKNITSIADYGLRGCYLTEAVLPNIVTLGAQPFREASSLTLVDIGSGLTSTSLSWAFMGCKQLSTLIIRVITPPSIDTYTFNGTKIASGTGIIYVPDAALEVYKTATNWSAYADRIHPLSELEGSPYIQFADAEVERVLMENNVSSDGVGITMADAEAVTSIGSWFKGNTAIQSFDEFGEFKGVKSLNIQTFYGCTSLESITIPASVSEIPSYGVFQNCTSLQRVTFNGDITGIYNEAFQGCSALSDINIPESVAGFGNSAFYGCTSMRIHLYLPNLITDNQWGTSRVFANTGILSANFPNVQKLGGDFFAGSKELVKVDIGASATSIGSSLCNGCSSLQALICRATTPPSIGNNIIAGASNAYIYVPDASVDAYKAATDWSTYASRIKPLSEYVES